MIGAIIFLYIVTNEADLFIWLIVYKYKYCFFSQITQMNTDLYLTASGEERIFLERSIYTNKKSPAVSRAQIKICFTKTEDHHPHVQDCLKREQG